VQEGYAPPSSSPGSHDESEFPWNKANAILKDELKLEKLLTEEGKNSDLELD
jgi:hypothetical protein